MPEEMSALHRASARMGIARIGDLELFTAPMATQPRSMETKARMRDRGAEVR